MSLQNNKKLKNESSKMSLVIDKKIQKYSLNYFFVKMKIEKNNLLFVN